MSELAPLDPDLLADVLSKHPFVTIDGVFNVRDLGMIPVAGGEYVTRSGFMYRSGELSGVTQHGVCHPSSFSRVFVEISESRQGAAAGPWYHHHIRPPLRHGNCKVRCSNPPNCRSNRIAYSGFCERGLQPRAHGPVSVSANPSSQAKPTSTVSFVDVFNFMQVEKRRCGSRPGSSPCLLPLDPRSRSSNCIHRFSTRAGPRSALSSATCGTRRMMPSSSIALVRSPVGAAIFY